MAVGTIDRLGLAAADCYLIVTTLPMFLR